MRKVFYLFTVLLAATFYSCKMGEETNPEYQVIHLQQNIQDDGYTEIERETLSGSEGSLTAAKAKTFEGFKAQTFLQEKIASKTEIQIKYDRIPVTFTLNLAGGNGVTSVTKKYGTPVTKENVPTPESEGSVFSFWSPELPKNFIQNGTYTANWDFTSYRVKYLFQNIEDDNYSESEEYPEKTFYGKLGDIISVTPESMALFDAKAFEGIELKEEGQVVNVYYDRKIITVFLDLDGSKGTSFLKGKAGAALTPEMFGTFTKTGYTNSGFDRELPNKFSLEDNNRTIAKILWIAEGQVRYGIKFYKQSKYSYEDAYYEAPEMKARAIGKTGELTKVEYKVSTNQYFINGTPVDITGFHPVEESSAYALKNKEILGDETTIVHVYLDRNVSTYTIDLNGGQTANGESNIVKGRYEEVVVMPSLTRKGYTRHSDLWENTDNDLIYFPAETTEKTYKAKWEPISYRVKYEFNRPENTMPVTESSKPLNELEYDKPSQKCPKVWSRPYHVFTGLNTKADGTGTQIDPDADIPNLTDVQNEEVTLYCQWSPYKAPELKTFTAETKSYSNSKKLYWNVETPAFSSDKNSFFDKNCIFSIFVNGQLVYRHNGEVNQNYSYSNPSNFDYESSKKYEVTACISYKHTDANGTYYLDGGNFKEKVWHSPLKTPGELKFSSCSANSVVANIDVPASEEGFSKAIIYYRRTSSSPNFQHSQFQELDITNTAEPGKINTIEISGLEADKLYEYWGFFKDKYENEAENDKTRFFTTPNLEPGKAYKGQIFYDDGTWSFLYEEGKTPVGIVLDVKADGTPSLIFSYEYLYSGNTKTYREAKDICKNYRSDKENYNSGWRLPSYAEVYSLTWDRMDIITLSINSTPVSKPFSMSDYRSWTNKSFDSSRGYYCDIRRNDTEKYGDENTKIGFFPVLGL
ncbi:hypothetical protein [Treponema sp.]|uniref:hypothetical protein n=1 Tax=Treponema sp. TaxID=166 RepID=UPI00298DFAB9|nr:hypothetical protein [Treponema sp.]MCQ2241529.1 hypothetical protein [Treponema sp.]